MNTIRGSRLTRFRMAALLATAAAMAQAQTYTATDLTPLAILSPPGAPLNNVGQVAGLAGTGPALVYSGGTVANLGTLPSGTYSEATAVNDNGQVVGFGDVLIGSTRVTHAFLYSGGTMIDLGARPGWGSSIATGINNHGQVTGYAGVGGNDRAFLYSNGSMIDLGTLFGGSVAYAYAINDSGQVVGYGDILIGASVQEHGFLYSGGRMIDLGTLGGTGSYAYGINNCGQVVGYSHVAKGSSNVHAFLYSGGNMIDLSTLPGGRNTGYAYGINDSGQVVGIQGDSVDQSGTASLYNGGAWADINTLVAPPLGQLLYYATAINNRGQVLARSSGATYLLTPGNLPVGPSSFSVLNPFAPYATSQTAPPILTMPGSLPAVLKSPAAASLAADGESAVVLAYQCSSPQPVTFRLSASGTGVTAGSTVGALGEFDPGYLSGPNPPTGGGTIYQATAPVYGPDAAGNYVFLALLWGPKKMPAADNASVTLAVSATQAGVTLQASLALEPPPLVLVHGIWSSAAGAGFTPGSNGFYDRIAAQYPHNLIYAADYGPGSAKAFSDPSIQSILLAKIADAVASAASAGMAARTVDVVAHSMGGLATRYLLRTSAAISAALLPNPVHRLITIGTPHQGSPLATTLVNQQGKPILPIPNGLVEVWCRNYSACTFAGMMNVIGRPIGAGVQSMEPGSPQLQTLSASDAFAAIAGQAPTPASEAEFVLNAFVGAFLSGQSLASIFSGQPNDTIVPVSSQNPLSAGQTDSATIGGLVHEAICCGDLDEPHSPSVWAQAFHWLTGGTGTEPSPAQLRAESPAILPPLLDLTGYSEVAATNFSILPTSGATLPINSTTNITATSPTKTIGQLLLLQNVTDPTDAPLLYATQSPFNVAFTPTRVGSGSFTAVAVFSDNTYASSALTYTLQPADTPYALNLVNAPVASINIGDTRVVQTIAVSPSGSIDVTGLATYSARSGSTNVFALSAGGAITASGNGTDLLDVSYGGITATVPVRVGTCLYALSPTNQIVPSTGGTVAIQVATQSGCGWTATGGASWLPFAQATGSGSGSILLTAAANSSGGTQGAIVYLGDLQAVITEPAAPCSYSLSATQISAPAAGARGTITATSACPAITSSDQSWLTATALGVSVQYSIAPNQVTSARSGTLTIGSVGVPVTQAAFNPCDLKQNGNINAADVVAVIGQALGVSQAANDFNGDGRVNVLDVQIEINAGMGLGCASN